MCIGALAQLGAKLYPGLELRHSTSSIGATPDSTGSYKYKKEADLNSFMLYLCCKWQYEKYRREGWVSGGSGE